MKLNRKIFFDQIKVPLLFSKGLRQSQVDGINAILDEWERQKHTDLRWLAYMFATAYHETGREMQAVEENGKGHGRKYGQRMKHSGVFYRNVMHIFYGRGLVQLTWYENYELMGRLLGVDLINHPELACRLDFAVKILFEGMLRGSSSVGDFTGRCLEQYFNERFEDWVGARKIINGTDCAEKIAEYGKTFHLAIKAAVPV